VTDSELELLDHYKQSLSKLRKACKECVDLATRIKSTQRNSSEFSNNTFWVKKSLNDHHVMLRYINEMLKRAERINSSLGIENSEDLKVDNG